MPWFSFSFCANSFFECIEKLNTLYKYKMYSKNHKKKLNFFRRNFICSPVFPVPEHQFLRMTYKIPDVSDLMNPDVEALWTSNVAMSTDLVNWTKYLYNPIVKGDHSSPVLVFDGKEYKLYTMHDKVWRYDAIK